MNLNKDYSLGRADGLASPKNPAAVALGTLGGKARTPKKALSSKENGKKGGRPKLSATLNS